MNVYSVAVINEDGYIVAHIGGKVFKTISGAEKLREKVKQHYINESLAIVYAHQWRKLNE